MQVHKKGKTRSSYIRSFSGSMSILENERLFLDALSFNSIIMSHKIGCKHIKNCGVGAVKDPTQELSPDWISYLAIRKVVGSALHVDPGRVDQKVV